MNIRFRAMLLVSMVVLGSLFVGWNFGFSATNTTEKFNNTSPRNTKPRNNGSLNWSQVEVISEPIFGQNYNDDSSSNPRIAVENGEVYVVWQDSSNIDGAGTDSDIFYRYFDGNTWSKIQIISEPVAGANKNTEASFNPDIAVEDGKIYVVWHDRNDTHNAGTGDYDIFYRCNITGSSWEPIQVISEPVKNSNFNSGESWFPSLAVENSKIYVVWRDDSDLYGAGANYDIFYRCNLTSTKWETIQVISEPVPGKDYHTRWSYEPEIVVENDNIYVVWRDQNDTNGAGTDNDIFYRCNLTGSSWEPVQVISEPVPGNDFNTEDSWSPSIAVKNSKIYVAWRDKNLTNGAGSDWDIFYRCNLSGLYWEKVQVISEPRVGNNYNSGDSFGPSIAVENSEIYVVWWDENITNNSGSDDDIFFRTNLTGSSWEKVQVISEPVVGYNYNIANSLIPNIAIDFGNIHVVWRDSNDTNGSSTDSDIFYKWIFQTPLSSLFLSSPRVKPLIGNTSTEFNFTVSYFHTNNSSPTGVKVFIDDIEYPMLEDDPADIDYKNGKKYYFKLKNLDMGTHTCNFWASNGTETITTAKINFPKVVNTPPKIITQDNLTAYEDSFYQVNYEFEDIDVDNVDQYCFWDFSTNASWLRFISTPTTLSGTPTNDDVGEYWVNISINDTMDIEFTNFTLTVIDVNDKPIITTTNIESTNEGELYNVEYSATDIDSPIKNQVWSLKTNGNSWLQINSLSGVLNGTPTNDDVGDYWVNVSVADGEGGTDSTNFTLTVINVNDPPSITTEDITLAVVNELYQVNYTAVDIDSIISNQLWSVDTDAGSWLAIDPDTGVLSGTPKVTDIGLFNLNVSVADGDGGSDWQMFKLTVITGNTPPIITTMDIDSVMVNTLYEVDYDATDDYTPNNELIWALETNASWLSINMTTGILSGTPTETDVGWYQVNVSVFDGVNGWDYHDFILTVTPELIKENNVPILTNPKIIPAEGDIETEFTFSVHYYDVDNDVPEFIHLVIDKRSYSMVLKTGENASNGIYESRIKLSEGTHTYYFKASDGKDTISTDNFTTPYIVKEVIDDDGKEPKEKASWNWIYWVVIIVIIIIIILLITALIFTKRKKRLIADVEYIPPHDRKAMLAAGTAAKPGAISAPTVIIDQVPSPDQPTHMPSPDVSAQPPTIPPPASVQPLLPPAPGEKPTPEPASVTTPAPTLAPTPTPAPVVEPQPTVVEYDTKPDFGIEGGPKPVQKAAVEHDVVPERVVEETDVSAATADLQAAAVVELAEEGAVVHDADTTIWRPEEKGKVVENKEVLEQLKTLSELKLAGALTEAEFQKKKMELLK